MAFSKSLLALSIGATLVLNGCVSTGSSGVDPRFNDKDFETDSEAAATACVIGAAAIGVTCLFIADSDTRALCLAAAAAGCALGLGGNALLDSLRQNYHTREQQLDGLISVMQENNQKANKLANTAVQVYKDDQKAFLALEKKIKAGQVEKSEVSSTIDRYDDTITLLTDNLKKHEEALDGYRRAKEGLIADGSRLSNSEKAKLQECDKRIAELEQSIELIRETRTAYIKNKDVLNLASNNSSAPSTAS